MPPTGAPILELDTHSPEETRDVGEVLGRHAEPGFVYLLSGELGTGKTTLTQGVLSGLDSDEHARSPTFVVVAQYAGRIPLYHIDLYRIDSSRELDDLGLDEYVDGAGLCVVEWADKAQGYFADDHLFVRIDHLGGETRRLSLTATSEVYDSTLEAVGANGRDGTQT